MKWSHWLCLCLFVPSPFSQTHHTLSSSINQNLFPNPVSFASYALLSNPNQWVSLNLLSLSLSLSLSLCVQLLQYRFYMTIYTNFQVKVEDAASSSKPEYKPGFLDHLFLNLFRNKLVQVDFLYLSQPCHMHILVIYFLLFYRTCSIPNQHYSKKFKKKKKILWF